MTTTPIDTQINTLTNTINQCEGSMVELNQTISEFEALVKQYEVNYSVWQAASQKYEAWQSSQQTFINSSINLPSNMTWNGLLQVNCNQVPQFNYIDALGTNWGMGNCNNADSNQALCTACGIKKCVCTAGLDSQCNSSKCNPKMDPGTFMTTTYYTAWLAANPQPPIPGPAPAAPPVPTVSANMVCTTCNQNINFSGATFNDATTLMQGALNQSQNCTATLNTQLSQLQTQKAAQLQAQAAAATTPVVQASLQGQAQIAQQAAAVASTPKTQSQLLDSHAAAVSQAATPSNTIIYVILFILLIFLICAGAVIMLYQPDKVKIST